MSDCPRQSGIAVGFILLISCIITALTAGFFVTPGTELFIKSGIVCVGLFIGSATALISSQYYCCTCERPTNHHVQKTTPIEVPNEFKELIRNAYEKR